MEAIRKQASKLREQVARQQQAVLKQLGHISNETILADEAELQCHQQLQNLYISTRTAKHFQRDLIRGVEGFISTSAKQMEIVRKLADNCCEYGNENQASGFALARASLQFGNSHSSMEKERQNLLKILADQVSEPLRTSVKGAPLEDARHLTHRYDRSRQEVEAQAAEVIRRQSKSKEAGASSETAIKLQNSEVKLNELKSAMMALGKEATAAMLSVEAHQQRITFQRLLIMVEAERAYHQNVAAILEKLHGEMALEKQRGDYAPQPAHLAKDVHISPTHEDANSIATGDLGPETEKGNFFLAKVIHPFDAQADGELSLSVGDYVVVRQVSPNGWSEGECKDKAGWFPSAYIERRDKAPASKIEEVSLA